MALNISAIGLTWISASAVMAFARHDKTMRFSGWAPQLEARVAADRNQVFHSITKDMHDAVCDSQIVFVALSVEEKKQVFKELPLMTRRDAVLINLTPPYQYTAQLYNEFVGQRSHYISLYPGIRGQYFHNDGRDISTASGNLFDGCKFFIAEAGNTGAAVLNLAVDISTLLGGRPVFTSPDELDGLISLTSIFPQLATVELMKTVSAQSGWHEGKYTAGNSLFQTTLLLDSALEPVQFIQETLLNRSSLLPLLNSYLRDLIELRDALLDQRSEDINKMITLAIDQRKKWLQERVEPQLAKNIPSVQEALRRIQKLAK